MVVDILPKVVRVVWAEPPNMEAVYAAAWVMLRQDSERRFGSLEQGVLQQGNSSLPGLGVFFLFLFFCLGVYSFCL